MAKGIMPPTYLIILLVLSISLHFIFPMVKFIFSPYNYLGFVLIAFGSAVNLWADSIFKKKKTTIKPHELPRFFIAFGPFKMSRHPMYLGMLSILLGVAIFLGSLVSFIFQVAFIVLMETLFIPTEERNMENQFGKEYLKYKKRVRRWI